MNNENRTNWYAPLEHEGENPAREEQAAEIKRTGLPLGWRIALGTLLALGLITGTSLFFANRASGEQRSAGEPRNVEEHILIEKPFELPLPMPETEMPEKWQDFFDTYFITEDESGEECRIPTVEKRPDWELELAEPGTREKSLQEVYTHCVDSIVSVRAYIDGKTGYHWGTGIVMSEDGLILTNAHLVAGCDSAEIILGDGSSHIAELVGTDKISDLAVLKIEAKNLKPAVFGDSEELSVGDRVAAIGNPLGEEFVATLTDGIVSGIDRGVNVDGRSMNMIQTNAAINEGSSGGALVNMYGQVVGVTNMKMISYYSSIEGICFAIPSATVRSVVNDLIRDGEVKGRPGVGITVGAIPANAVDFYKMPEGLYISGVSKGSDAEAKGIQVGDVITAVNGEPAKSSNDILRVRDSLQVGDTITFTIWRDGKTFDKDVALVEYSDVY